jgi:hypothetical protein
MVLVKFEVEHNGMAQPARKKLSSECNAVAVGTQMGMVDSSYQFLMEPLQIIGDSTKCVRFSNSSIGGGLYLVPCFV